MAQIKTKANRGISPTRFSQLKYKGEVISSLVKLLVLRFEESYLDHILDELLEIFEVHSVEDIMEEEEHD